MTNISRTSEQAPGGIPYPTVDPSFNAALSLDAYRTLAALIYQHSRIKLGPDKRSMLANRLRKRLRALGLPSYEDYCAVLKSAQGLDEIEHLVDLISTNHTKFFREPDHFAVLASKILPQLVADCARRGDSLRVWSAAASSGEEPYTLAIVLAEYFREHPSVPWQIDATDISNRMLEVAGLGIYPLDRQHALEPQLFRRYFQKGVEAQAGKIRVKADLRARVKFQRVNLFQPEYPVDRDQHVIFCRNVMIYFDLPSREALVQKLTRHLAPGGFLVIGHSESLLGIRMELQSFCQSVFRKP